MDEKGQIQTGNASYGSALKPAAIAVGIWLALHVTYDLLGFIDDIRLYRNLAAITWVLLVISVGFSSVVIYPLTWFRGVPFRLRVLAVYALPLAWCIKEFIRVSANITIGEALFYVFFTSIQLLILIGQVGLMGLLEILCRLKTSRQTAGVRVFHPGAVIAVLVTVFCLYFLLIRGGGYDFVLSMKMVYRALFL